MKDNTMLYNEPIMPMKWKEVRKEPDLLKKIQQVEISEILEKYRDEKVIKPPENIDENETLSVIWQRETSDNTGTAIGYLLKNHIYDDIEVDYIFAYSKAGLEEIKDIGNYHTPILGFEDENKIYISQVMFANFADKVLPNEEVLAQQMKERNIVRKRADSYSRNVTDDYYLARPGIYISLLKKNRQALARKLIDICEIPIEGNENQKEKQKDNLSKKQKSSFKDELDKNKNSNQQEELNYDTIQVFGNSENVEYLRSQKRRLMYYLKLFDEGRYISHKELDNYNKEIRKIVQNQKLKETQERDTHDER